MGKIKASYSQISLYKSCPMAHHLQYRERWKSVAERASLFFGNYVEAGCIALLEKKPDYMRLAHEMWESQSKWGNTTKINNNPNIVYANGDFDQDVLKEEDLSLLSKLSQDLGLDKLADNPVAIYKEVKKIKVNPYKKTTSEMMQYFSKCSWLSLRRKGEILIEAFKEQFLPRVEEVISIQEQGDLSSDTGEASLTGFIDFVIKLKDYGTVICDLKTSSGEYCQEKMLRSEQLVLYAAMLGLKYQTNLVAYIVLNKQIQKVEESYCTKCGAKKESSHRTCANMVDGKRCGGDWKVIKRLAPEVQVLVANKEDSHIDALLKDYANVLKAFTHGIVYKNLSQCDSLFGSPCVFRSLCDTGSCEGLVKK